jgi:DUF2934 family protein
MARRPNRRTSGREIPIKQVSEFSMGDDELLQQRIAKKAYELYECRGCCNGRDLDDWLEAEQLVLADVAKKKGGKTKKLTNKRGMVERSLSQLSPGVAPGRDGSWVSRRVQHK